MRIQYLKNTAFAQAIVDNCFDILAIPKYTPNKFKKCQSEIVLAKLMDWSYCSN